MNDAGREKLIAASLAGVKQAYGRLHDVDNAKCAMGVLGVRNYLEMEKIAKKYDIKTEDYRYCDLCGDDGEGPWTELALITHYNDRHKFDFLTIARKI